MVKESTMKALVLRTDKPEAELGVFDGQKQSAYESWQAHRELSDTIHLKIKEILGQASISAQELEGIVVFEGPGSFTGLRIGITVANAMAYAYAIPVVATGGKNWIKDGLKKLEAGQNDKIALPKYGAEPNITQPKK